MYIQSFAKSRNIIIHIGTNDATHSTSREILDKLLKLKTLIKETLSETEVTFSTLTTRSDNGKAAQLASISYVS